MMDYKKELETALRYLTDLKIRHDLTIRDTDLDLFLKRHAKRRWAVYETTDGVGGGPIKGSPYVLVECYESGVPVEEGCILGKFIRWAE
jgi:hypothetical protein